MKNKDDKRKSEMRAVLLPTQAIYDEIDLLRCANPLSDSFSEKLLSIVTFANPEYTFKDNELERMKIDLINLCSEIMVRFTGYDCNAAESAYNRGNFKTARMLSNREVESYNVLTKFVKAFDDFVLRILDCCERQNKD